MAQTVAVRIDLKPDLVPLFERAGAKSLYAIGRAIDEVGNKTRTQVTRAVAKQAGVRYGKARAVISARQAMGAGEGEYQIIARDITLSLKEFGPRQTAKGVSAAPWGRRIVFVHSFIGPNGHVFVRLGKPRLPIKKLWGPNIPKEMVKDQAAATFFRVSEELLGDAIAKWLLRQTV